MTSLESLAAARTGMPPRHRSSGQIPQRCLPTLLLLLDLYTHLLAAQALQYQDVFRAADEMSKQTASRGSNSYSPRVEGKGKKDLLPKRISGRARLEPRDKEGARRPGHRRPLPRSQEPSPARSPCGKAEPSVLHIPPGMEAKCLICSKASKRRAYMTRHAIVHKVFLSQSHTCPACGETTTTPSEWSNHAEQRHGISLRARPILSLPVGLALMTCWQGRS